MQLKIAMRCIPAITALLVMTGCEPEINKPEELSSVSITNVAPGAPTFDVMVDGLVRSQARLTYGNSSVSVPGATTYYLSVMSGERNIKASVDTGKTTPLIDVTEQFAPGMVYTYVITDTVLNGKLKTVRLVDDLSLPAANQVKFRIVHAAPASGPVDVTFLRAAGPDSVTISNLNYVGNLTNPDIAMLSKFFAGPSGAYTVKVKMAGTQTVILSSAATLAANRIYTFFLRGGVKSVPLTVGSVANY